MEKTEGVRGLWGNYPCIPRTPCNNQFAVLSECYVNSTVYGNDFVGGFLGSNYIDNNVQNCHSSGTVYGMGVNISGFIGYNSGILEYCNSSVNVYGGKIHVGGFIGLNNGSVVNCYSKNDVTEGEMYVGGFIGLNGGSISISNS